MIHLKQSLIDEIWKKRQSHIYVKGSFLSEDEVKVLKELIKITRSNPLDYEFTTDEELIQSAKTCVAEGLTPRSICKFLKFKSETTRNIA